MVLGVVDQPVVGEYDPLGAPGGAPHGVDVALGVGPALLLREQALVVAEAAAAERLRLALERADSLEASALREEAAESSAAATDGGYRYNRDNEGFFD